MERLRKTAYILIIAGLALAFLYVARSLIIPIMLAGLLAMLFRGMSRQLENRGRPRWFTALISVGIFLLGLTLIFSALTWQLSAFSDNLTEIRARLSEQFSALRDWVQETAGISPAEQEELVEKGASAASSEGGGLAAFALGTLSALLDLVLVVVYMYLLLYFRGRIKDFILMITPQQHRGKTKKIIFDATLVSQQYLSGLMAMIAVLWVLFGVGFSIIGVQGALFFAILCGLMEIIPFVGNFLGSAITVLAVLAQGGGTGMILGVIAVYIIVQGLQTYILEPLIVGRQVRINPLFIIIVLVAGELLWGVGGMILAIPVLGIIKIICDHIPSLRPYGYLIGSETRNNNT